MKIKLTQGKYAIVDNEDYKKVSKYLWYLFPNGSGNLYAKRNVKLELTKKWKDSKKTTQLMHRFILGLDFNDKQQVDHINGNGLDNRKENLRVATSNLNNHNRLKLPPTKTSKYKGVSRCNQTRKWIAFITHYGKSINLGRYDTEIEAALAYNIKAVEIYGDEAVLNALN